MNRAPSVCVYVCVCARTHTRAHVHMCIPLGPAHPGKVASCYLGVWCSVLSIRKTVFSLWSISRRLLFSQQITGLWKGKEIEGQREGKRFLFLIPSRPYF